MEQTEHETETSGDGEQALGKTFSVVTASRGGPGVTQKKTGRNRDSAMRPLETTGAPMQTCRKEGIKDRPSREIVQNLYN